MGEIAAVQVIETGWDELELEHEHEPPSPIDPRRASFPRPPTPTPELDLLRDLDTPVSHPFNAALWGGERPSPTPRRAAMKRASLPPPPLKLRPGSAVFDTAPLSAPLLGRPCSPFTTAPPAREPPANPPPPPQTSESAYIPAVVRFLSLLSLLPLPLLHLLLSWPWHKTKEAWHTHSVEGADVQCVPGYDCDEYEDLVEDGDDGDAEEENEDEWDEWDEWDEYDSNWSEDLIRTASIEKWRSATAVEVDLRHKNWPAPPSPPLVHRTEDGLLDW